MFLPLHLKSDYSLGYGTASIEELVARATQSGYDVLALTDLENLYGQVRFHACCRRFGIRAISGVELRPGFAGRLAGAKAGRLLLLAADECGYASLCRIVSARRGVTGGKRYPPDPLPLVLDNSRGLIVLSDDPQVVERLAVSLPRERIGLLLVRPEDPSLDRARQEAARRLGVRLVADLDAVFLSPADLSLHLLLQAIRQGKRAAGIEPSESRQRLLRPRREAEDLFADVPAALVATGEVAEACSLDLTRLRSTPPPPSDGETEMLRSLSLQAASKKPAGSWTPAHRRRLEEELRVVAGLGFTRFMLTVAQILSRCSEEGIPLLLRGSAVSSLLLHLLAGSPVDPVAEGLLFERFLHRGKSRWPDVDIDLPWHRRDEVIDWVFRRFGSGSVAMVAAHHTFRYRSALREGLKALGAPASLIEELGRRLPPEELGVVEADFLDIARGADDPLAAAGEELGEVAGLLRRLVGKPRHISVHPAGIVVEEGVRSLLPLELSPKGVVVAQYDLLSVAELGLVKIDLLGNRCLSELQEALELAGETRHPTASRRRTGRRWSSSTARQPLAASSWKAPPSAPFSPASPSAAAATSPQLWRSSAPEPLQGR